MNEELRLPWNNKEGFIYGFVIALFTATFMIVMNVVVNTGLNFYAVATALIRLPLMIVVVMLIETFVIGRIGSKFTMHFSSPTDGFNANILFSILFTVTGMSMVMTIIGPWVMLGFDLGYVAAWPANWPRNFCIVFWYEVLIAQPAARLVMKNIHIKKIAKAEGEMA